MSGFAKMNVAPFHVNQVVYLIASKKMGRRKIVTEIGLSESKTRTMLNHLAAGGYVKATKAGYELEKKGMLLLKKIKSKLKEVKKVELKEIVMDKENIAMLLSGAGNIGSGIALRDEAIKAGASGMTVLMRGKNGFSFPVKSRLTKGALEIKELGKRFPQAREKDVLLICSAGKEEDAKKGLWMAFGTML